MWFRRREATLAPDPGEALRSAIREHVRRAVTGEVQAGSDPVAEVQRLAQLLAAYEQSRPPRPRRVWPVVALLLATALAVSALLFVRVPSTEVTLALDLSSLGFRIGHGPEPGRIDLLARVNADQMSIDDVDAVELDDRPVATGEASSFTLSAAGVGSISLHPLQVPVGTWVRVNRPDATGALTLELGHPDAELEVAMTLPPEIEILPADAGLATRFDPNRGAQRGVFRAGAVDGSACARLRLRWQAAPAPVSPSATGAPDLAPFRAALPVDALLFTDLEGGDQGTQYSTVLGGLLYLEAVAGREVEIRRDQLLDVGLGPAASEQGVSADAADVCGIRSAPPTLLAAPARLMRVAVGADAIAVQAEASVHRLSTGTANNRLNLMPRSLEWLQTRQELLLFWGAFGSLFGLAYTVLLWWRGNR